MRREHVLTFAVAVALLLGGWGFFGPRGEDSLARNWGVEVQGIRLSAAGTMLDFRYRVLDPNKALPLFDRHTDAYLVDEATGVKLAVPSPPKVGPLRQTMKYGRPAADRVYFVFFGNPGRKLAPGAKVTVVIGDFRAEHLRVL